MREIRTLGSVPGAAGDCWLYGDVRRAKLGIYWFGESPNSGRLSKPPISSVALLLVTVIVKRTQRLYRP